MRNTQKIINLSPCCSKGIRLFPAQQNLVSARAAGVGCSVPASEMGLWSLSRHRACIVPTICCGCPTGWDGRERDEWKHRTGPTSCIYIHAIHLLLKCRAGEGGITAQAGVSPGLGWQLQLLEGLSLAMVKNQHPLPPSFKKTNKIWDFSKGLHSGSVCSLHLGQGVLILHTKSFHHSSEEKQGEKRLTFLLYPDTVLKK